MRSIIDKWWGERERERVVYSVGSGSREHCSLFYLFLHFKLLWALLEQQPWYLQHQPACLSSSFIIVRSNFVESCKIQLCKFILKISHSTSQNDLNLFQNKTPGDWYILMIVMYWTSCFDWHIFYNDISDLSLSLKS